MSNEQLRIYHRKNRTLPFTESPIRFAVTKKNGLTSNVWGVSVEEPGDAYIYCRDMMKELKISLHESGKQHIAFTEESRLEMTPGNRFWNQWREPPSQRPPVPTFKLVFPGWALGFNEEDRKKRRPKKWDTNDILIEGHDELLTVVSFFIMDKGLVPQQQGLPSGAIGILSLRPGKDLVVVAHREYERNFKSVVLEGIKRAAATRNFQSGVAEAFKRAFPNGQPPGADEKVFEMCLTGDEPLGYAYLVVVRVAISSR